nr:MAG TPA: hypothetical protein [Caudoviricetes sp.]
MICEVCKERIKHAAKNEKDAAIAKHGHFHSQHEAWAVLKEEIEEMCQSVNRDAFKSMLCSLWIDVTHDKQVKQDKLDEIYDAAFACACEAVQVMAMCLKWGESFGDGKKQKGELRGDED